MDVDSQDREVRGERPLGERLQGHLERTRLLPAGRGVTVALSGGVDSVALLHLLLDLKDRWGWRLSVAHFDHALRPGSRGDAEWVAALAERRGLPVRVGRAERPPRSEARARELRYDFLFEARRELGGDLLATAHQADDQAETVLFRLLRGTGLRGLAGIPARRAPGVVRPLLPFWRAEIEAYARASGLEYREDPTNRDRRFARNRLRHDLIPRIEAEYVPDFRDRLQRLARRARGRVRAMDQFVREAAEGLILEADESRIVVARSGFLAYDSGARAYLLRDLVDRIGPRPGRVGTRTALEFIRSGSSGRRIELAGGVELRREFDRLIVERRSADGSKGGGGSEERPLCVPEPGEGQGEAMIGGFRWRARWSRGDLATKPDELTARFDLTTLEFPLVLRSWRPGDRIQLPAGGRKLKKVFVDRRVGLSERSRQAMVADRSGVLWVGGLVQGSRAAGEPGREVFTVTLGREG